jgi:uncharacterized protein YqgV (UPF0045/DUF77 family)
MATSDITDAATYTWQTQPMSMTSGTSAHTLVEAEGMDEVKEMLNKTNTILHHLTAVITSMERKLERFEDKLEDIEDKLHKEETNA